MSALGLGLGLGLGAQSQRRNNDMILVYEIPSAGTNIELAIQANSTYFPDGQGVVIDWGDGSAAETVSAASDHTGYIGHTYAAEGTYTIKISGSMTMYGRGELGTLSGEALLTHIRSFGELGITSFAFAFYNCTGLVSVPQTLPDSVTNMSYTFRSCSGATFNPDVSNWDVSNVTTMREMFRNCSGATFNPDFSNWDVSKVTDMYVMFDGCYGAAFNPGVSKWDVSKVTDMFAMFRSCYGAAFNPDVSNWNVSNVTRMNSMFQNCYGAAFNPDMKIWTLKTGVNTSSMFTGSRTQSKTWLDDLLVAWAANPEQGNNITIDFSPNKFTEVEGAPLHAVDNALQTLEGKGWTIITANPYSST